VKELSQKIEQLEKDIRDGRKKLEEVIKNGAELEDLKEIADKIEGKKKELRQAKLAFDYQANDLPHEDALNHP